MDETRVSNPTSCPDIKSSFAAKVFILVASLLAAPAQTNAGGSGLTEISSLIALSDNRSNSFLRRDADIFVLAGIEEFRNLIVTFELSADGTSIIEINSLVHDRASAPYNSLVRVDSDTYALAYQDAPPDDNLIVKTFTISADGATIKEEASLAHDRATASYNSLVRLDSDTYVLAYSGLGSDGFIKTFTISADGTSITEESSLEHDPEFSQHNSLVQVDLDTYVLAYSGPDSDGFIKTFTISADGTSITEEDSLEHDPVFSQHNSLVQVDSDTYALAYRGLGGTISTFSIFETGSMITEIASLEHDLVVTDGENSLVQVGPEGFVLAYRGPDNDGFIKTFDISADGASITEIDALEHDEQSGTSSSLVQMASDIVALAYQDSNSNGVIKTFDIGLSPEDRCSVLLPLICPDGELSVSCQDVIFPRTKITGADVVAQANAATWTASDTTCLGAGWHVTLVAADHFRGRADPKNHVIPIGENEQFTVECFDTEIVPIGDAGIPPTCPSGVQPIPLIGENPLTILYADPGQGIGGFEFVPHFEIVVPGTAIIDIYTTEIWVDIIAGP